jgi:hypothetical protein
MELSGIVDVFLGPRFSQHLLHHTFQSTVMILSHRSGSRSPRIPDTRTIVTAQGNFQTWKAVPSGWRRRSLWGLPLMADLRSQ